MTPDEISAHFRLVRNGSVELSAPLSAEDCCVQSMPDASPVKWHLAHTTWFFETFILERWESGFRPFHEAFRVLYNSYYNAVGDRHPRPQRGLLTRPTLATVLAYRADVDRRMATLLLAGAGGAELLALLALGLQHEQQHQELILTDLKHLFSLNPLAPAYGPPPPAAATAATLDWHAFAGGVVAIGHAGGGFAFDNETPRHRVFLEPYELASRLVSNGEFLQFIEAGGYADPTHWLAEGWDWRLANDRRQPLYWRRGQEWQEFTLGGLVPLDQQRPLLHVSYYEADAYARWAGARLPTEAEWENAAADLPVAGHFAGRRQYHPSAATAGGLQQLFGDAWEWTCSSYAPYPGFRPGAGAVGEYNGKFMVNQYVLRGGSCVTPEGHLRATYRNFFPAATCWQFSAIRLARDAGAVEPGA
ncbi:ergothioneine biosynthesis protein EgtB [Accumulibacter sp.]|jgi:ergothioneine biosynthesis protein EgtB|uniref:ergothioneine biosynthesis protein EgtB n=1 Tax=Accumulibacter sp. TaxID=2053492 RepID=UPI001AD540BD|nr:ergothioneine biosynthesis protein EgtB [Accumulibacter sp.]MBN8452019.1 ergothioneine biosynthesis protein EgtB [Accumulibacter sp.]MBO3706903.1 ergothioneine biosynthesis protein EgtB [Candidatus Accumulibacter conexus]